MGEYIGGLGPYSEVLRILLALCKQKSSTALFRIVQIQEDPIATSLPKRHGGTG